MIEILKKIQDKSGLFEIVFLIGKSFSLNSEFAKLSELELLSNQFIIYGKTYILILDYSEIGSTIKHKHPKGIKLRENVYLLGRSGIYELNNFTVSYKVNN